MNALRKLKNTHVLQQGQSDCGVACLKSILRYYGGDARLERLRELSGTTIQGTTLLGLYQAAGQMGFDAEGLEAEAVGNLRELGGPAILHVVTEEYLQHYVVFYGFEGDVIRLGDPARGLLTVTPAELEAIWVTKALLSLTPNPAFIHTTDERRRQRQWLLALLRDDWPLLGLSAGLGVVLAGLSVSTALFSQQLVDDILPSRDQTRLWLGLTLLAVLLLARAGLGLLRGLLLARQALDFNNRVADGFFGLLLRLPKPFFDGRSTGEFVARLHDTRRIQHVLGYLAGQAVIALLVALAAAAALFAYSMSLGLTALLSVPLFGGLAWRYGDRISEAQQEIMRSYARTESHYVDAVQGIEAIKAANREDFFGRLARGVYGQFQARSYALSRLALRFSFWAEAGSALLVAGSIGWAAFLVLGNRLTLGELIAVLGLVGTIVPAVSSLALVNIQVQEARVAFDRMVEFAQTPPEVSGAKQSAPLAPSNQSDSLEARDVTFRFPGRSPLLDGVSLRVRPGEIVALLGETGSGKSTLLQLLMRFYAPECGEIRLNGHASWSLVDWRNRVGLVPQHVKLFNGTLLDNLLMASTAGEAEELIEWCRDWGFDRFFTPLPLGYLTPVGEDGINLSGGQRQLVGLARVLYRRPRFVLLDEPTAALDRQTEAFVTELLGAWKANVGIVLVTHRASTARAADRAYQIHGRHVLEIDFQQTFAAEVAA